MKLVRKFWTSVKRNPVINAFAVAVIVQVAQDYAADAIDWQHISGYLCAMFLAIGARMLVVPAKEHDEKVAELERAKRFD